MKRLITLLALASTASLVWMPAARAGTTYIALGDSITFGETDLQYVPSLGDRGYVSRFADFIGQETGERPDVVNLAIDGETADSFMTGIGRTPPVVGRTDAILAAQNANYDPADLFTQRELFFDTAETAAAAGNPVTHVSITLGFNELAALASDPTTALAKLPATLDAFRANFGQVLTEVRQQLFGAQVVALGYYNPFPADPQNPATEIFATGGPQLNAIIEELAATYDADYVDPSGLFIGNEAAFTFLDEMPGGSTVGDPFGGLLPIGNVHPNDLGYAAIADAITGEAPNVIPLPAAVWAGLVTLGGMGGGAWVRRRLFGGQAA